MPSKEQREDDKEITSGVACATFFSLTRSLAVFFRFQELPRLLEALPNILPDQGPKVTSTKAL